MSRPRPPTNSGLSRPIEETGAACEGRNDRVSFYNDAVQAWREAAEQDRQDDPDRIGEPGHPADPRNQTSWRTSIRSRRKRSGCSPATGPRLSPPGSGAYSCRRRTGRLRRRDDPRRDCSATPLAMMFPDPASRPLSRHATSLVGRSTVRSVSERVRGPS